MVPTSPECRKNENNERTWITEISALSTQSHSPLETVLAERKKKKGDREMIILHLPTCDVT